jgi:hypothetical protein
VIIGVHALIYSGQPEAVRDFFSDVLGLPSVDAGGGWPIFKLPPAELAVHPTEKGAPHHELWLMCDDVEATIAELAPKGVKADPISEQSWGLITTLRLASGEQIGLYEPKHPTLIR